jgi:TonB-dependent starch-binding outer membrane protein SusC
LYHEIGDQISTKPNGMQKILRLVFFLIVCSGATELWAQERVVTGKVTSAEDSSPLPGVNILVKGTSIGTVTDADGSYSVSVPDGSSILVLSFIGFVTSEVNVSQRSKLDVKLTSDVAQLSEVIVTGYSEESSKSLIGSVAKVKAKDIQNVPIASIDQILQGRAAGMLVLGNSGQPGASASVTIRGSGSIDGGNNPLYVLDGVPIDPTRFNTINWNDIENISVLKDASTTALYGSRGSNGVIVLTSKKGKGGKTEFNYNVQYGQSYFPENKLELMSTNEKIDYELSRGGTGLSNLSDEEITDLRKINTNWADILTRTGTLVSHELSASGGNDRTTFFVSGNYFAQQGTVIDTELKRYNARVNLRHESGNFRFGFNNSLGFSKNQGTREANTSIAAPLNAIRWANPYETPRDAQGEYTDIRTSQPNPLEELVENPRKFNDIKVVSNISGEYDIPSVKGVTIKTNWGVDYDYRDGTNYTDRTTAGGQAATGGAGLLNRTSRYDVRFVGTSSISYNTSLRENHSLSAALYHEINYRQIKNFGFIGFGLTGNLKNEAGLTISDVFLPELAGNNSESALVSYFGDFKYGYKDKYFLKAGVRRDGSSRFGSENRFANFYSIGSSWVVSDEAFAQSFKKVINSLKLNLSYGTTGNQEDIGDYASRELYATGFTYAGDAGLILDQLTSPSLRWESQNMLDIGLDIGFFENRIRTGVTYYNRLTSDLLLGSQLSRTTGFDQLLKNVGEVRNRGYEITLDIDVIRSGNFVWNVTGNFTNNKNEIVSLSDGKEIINGATINRVGHPINSNYVVEYAGVNPANGDALYRKLDGSITNEFAAGDLKIWGTRVAPRFGGFSNTLSYKGLEFSFFFSFVHGNSVYNNDRTNVEDPTYLVDQMAKSNLRAWKQPGDITDVPRQATIDGLTTNPYQRQTTRYIENGSFLRLRNVQLSYVLPSRLTSAAKLRSVRMFLQGQNIWTRSEFLGFDPELATGTLAGAQYPAMRSITAGLNIGF